jgi:hypothetical protein
MATLVHSGGTVRVFRSSQKVQLVPAAGIAPTPQAGQPCDCTTTATSTALNASMILWPVRFTSATPGLRLLVTGGGTTTVSLAVTVGRNYWMAGDAQADSDGSVGGVGDVLKILQTALNTNPYGATFTVALTSWRIVISVSAGSFQILWADGATSSDLPGIFGYAAATSPSVAAATSTGTLLPRGLWRPQIPVGTDTREREPTVGGIALAVGGSARVSSLVDHPLKERTLSWGRVRQEYSLTEYQLSTEPTGSFEYAFVNSIKLGRPLRYYADETVRTASSYGLYRIANLARDPLVRTNPSISNTRWGVGPIDLRKLV